MIKVEGLTRRFGQFTAVDNVSFVIPAGQIVGLLGHNGAGKTTIMKMLTGFLEPSSGNIWINGKDVCRPDDQSFKADIGYLPENLPVYPELTILDYLDYVAELRGIKVTDRAVAIRRVVAQTALAEKVAQPIGTLSRGYRQRVGVAQALLAQPKLLILDEPTNGLDPTQINQMRDLILALKQQTTIILSTHILQEVKAVCDRVIIISNGRLALDNQLSNLEKGLRLNVGTDATEAQMRELSRQLVGCESVETIKREAINHENPILHYAIALTENCDRHAVTASFAKAMIEKGYALYSLEQEQYDLESVFHSINEQRSVANYVA